MDEPITWLVRVARLAVWVAVLLVGALAWLMLCRLAVCPS
jgi:hypothetical protein